MRMQKLFLFLFMIITVSFTANAQKKPAAKPGSTVQKFKPPKLQTTLSTYQGPASISVEQAVNIIGLPLKIYDDKKNEYAISSYQFVYRKVGVTEDENTGKVTPVSSMSADRFRTTPLPDVWVKTIKNQLKSGEELYFVDIIVKDTQGHVMYAPELKISIQ